MSKFRVAAFTGRVFPCVLPALLSAFAVLSAESPWVEWALYDDPACLPEAPGSGEVRCGDAGVYVFGSERFTSGCVPIASGEESAPWYPPPIDSAPFPGVEPHEPTASSAPMAAAGDWLAVIDFSGPHGESTQWLVDAVGDPAAGTELMVLDDPALVARFGALITDFHVLAGLCAIAERIDVDGDPPPRVVNMSFGRAVRPVDPAGDGSCDASRASCQIARVIEHVSAAGTRFVAAAGNHRQVLFPAALPRVTHVGLLDLDTFFMWGEAVPAWESSEAVLGLFPGNTLCLADSWPAPAGSSYSSAMFSGWLAHALFHGASPEMTPELGQWAPLFEPALGCWVLSRGSEVFPWCNAEITRLFSGLEQGGEESCGTGAGTRTEHVDAGTPGPQPGLPSFDEWTAAVHPTPESDPCVPCWGRVVGMDLDLDVSRAAPLSPGTYLDSIYLRDGTTFRRLPATAATLAGLAAAQIRTLHIVGAGGPASGSLSFWYALKDDGTATCQPPGRSGPCYWSSTPVRLLQ